MIANQLIPELAVRDTKTSLAFYCDVLDFLVEYQRPEEGFAMVSLGATQLMLDQIGLGRTFGENRYAQHLGLGLNLQVLVGDEQLNCMLDALEKVGNELYLPLEEKWYRKDDIELGNRQFVVADPDGYLLRFSSDLGTRGA